MITVYSVGCPKCVILEKRLLQANINYKVCEDRELMEKKGFDFMPVLEVDGKCMNFNEAINWIGNHERG